MPAMRTMPAALAAAALLALTGCGGDSSAAEKAPDSPAVDGRLSDTYDACVADGAAHPDEPKWTLELADGGQTLLVDTNPSDDGTGIATYFGAYECTLEELDVPQSTISKIERTTAMMGVQEASHDGLDFSWTYHPDNGTELLITVQEPGIG